MTKRRWTRERTLKELEQRARQMSERDFALSLRQLDRWLAGEVGVPRAATCRVVEKEFGRPIAELLMPFSERDEAEQGSGRGTRTAGAPGQRAISTGWLLPDTGAPEQRIAICGSRGPTTDGPAIDAAVRALGRLLMHCRCRVSHGPIGVGIEVMTHIADHYRPPNLGAVTGIFGRPNIIRDADYVLVVGGGAGTQDEVDLAISAGKKLIPLPASGGTARRTYALMERDPSVRSWMPDQAFNALETADAEGFTRIVERVLSAALEKRMSDRPYVLLSCAMSIDGYIDDATERRLLLSNDADFDRVDAERAGCDAIMVGANTIRRDNPRLLVRSVARREERVARGVASSPIKVTLTGAGDLDPAQSFFTAGDNDKLVYCASTAVDKLTERLADVATIVDAGDPPSLHTTLADLASRGVRRLMVEGGSSLHTQFLTAGLADELHLVVAPFLVGDSRAPSFVGGGAFPWDSQNRMTLAGVQQIGDVALLRYLLAERSRQTDA